MNETNRAVRNMYEVILRNLTVLVLGLAIVGSGVGYLVAGMPGVWGALMAAGIAALFMIGTVIAMLVTADKPIQIASAAGVGGWLVKMVIMFGVLVLVRGRDFYSPGTFFVVLVLALIGSFAIEATAVLKARVPNVEPAGDAEQPGDLD
ncbi:hypothetical protein FE374_13415 [Georgenia yuyongxinii]|uniref:ATP synthase protein I n=1 Tax=Georgenia yuyongxinii TaxID=2589797 RepID=A0A5B8C565_9MICO|nr:hypothetical protein [Georgenia yuyongxinii]QDC25478.1 hypothetical protein FE374_13415 [Georgenia yuyongxinii]